MSDRKSVFVHDRAVVESDQIGDGTRIWAGVHILPGAVVGRDCNIGENCYIESCVVIGDRVTVKNGISLWDGVTIEDDVFLGPHMVFTNDKYARAFIKVPPDQLERTLVKRGATIGANATLLSSLTVGEYALVGAGAVVTRDVPAYRLFAGNPAREAGYVCQCARQIRFEGARARCGHCGKEYRLAPHTHHVVPPE